MEAWTKAFLAPPRTWDMPSENQPAAGLHETRSLPCPTPARPRRRLDPGRDTRPGQERVV